MKQDANLMTRVSESDRDPYLLRIHVILDDALGETSGFRGNAANVDTKPNDASLSASGAARENSPKSTTVWNKLSLSADALVSQIEAAVRASAEHRGCWEGELSVFVTDDATIRTINQDHLNHDYATDVISFGYELDPPFVEGELTVSLEMALTQATVIGREPFNELLMYVVHGTLHVTGMEDSTAADRHAMRAAERSVLLSLGVDDSDRFHADRFDALDGTGDDS
ncbi:MAG: rRNA maturation RNase YbeY [Planctomycetota bacterium]